MRSVSVGTASPARACPCFNFKSLQASLRQNNEGKNGIEDHIGLNFTAKMPFVSASPHGFHSRSAPFDDMLAAAAAAHPRWKNDGTSGREGERDETTQIDSSAEAEGEARAEIMIRDDATSLYRKRPLCPQMSSAISKTLWETRTENGCSIAG